MKLQPNFSWQTYEGTEEDQRSQFEYQLQHQFVIIANSVNATINDLSYYTRERPTSFLWLDTNNIFTQTVATQAWTAAGTINTIPLAIVGNFSVINMEGTISNGSLSTSTTNPLPYLDVTTGANNIQMQRVGTNIILTSQGTDYSAWSGYITVYYIKNK